MIKQYAITDYIKDDPELQKAVIDEFLNDIKRLQAENEEFKKEIWKLQHREMWNKEATLQAELLIKEKERLKEFCIQLEKAKEEQHLQWQQRCTENHNEDSKLIEKYRKALEEIRGLAQSMTDDYEEMDIEQQLCYCQQISTQIVQKISEVEDER